jgi:hypothetical protein
MINKPQDTRLRVDKNVAFNVIQFEKVADRQTAIILKALVIYFSKSFERDLFGYETLDPYKFAKEMDINRATLFKRHPNPAFVKNHHLSRAQLEQKEKESKKIIEEVRIWDSYLENALYILFSHPIFESYKGSTETSDFVGLSNFLILRDISVHAPTTNSGRNQKLYYKYKLDEYFERNLRKYFLQVDIKIFTDCKNKGVEGFYLQLMSIYESYKKKGLNIYHWKLDELLKYFTISDKIEIKHQKQKLIVQLKKVEKLMSNTIPGLSFDWIKGDNQRWAYVPVVRWDKVNLQDVKENDHKILDDVFLKHLKRHLLEVYIRQTEGTELVKTDFYRWLGSTEDKDLKVSSYVSVSSIYRKNTGFPQPKTLATNFYLSLKGCKNVKEVDNMFNAFYKKQD